MSARARALLVAGSTALSIASVVSQWSLLVFGGLVLTATLSWAAVAWAELRAPMLSIRIVFVLAAIGIVACAVAPPRMSRDVWSYEMYGRISAVHHRDPYLDPPSKFSADPFLARVNPRWRNTNVVYGPIFVVVARGIAGAAGDHPLVARLAFQGFGALALVIAVGLVARRSRRESARDPDACSQTTLAVVLLALSPVTLVAAINSAHVDVWLVPVLIGAVVAVGKQRWLLAGTLLAGAALVKITALVLVVGAVACCCLLGRWRTGCKLAGSSLAITGMGYLLSSQHALNGLRQNATLVSRASVWAIPRWLLSSIGGQHADRELVSAASIGVVVATVGIVALGTRRRSSKRSPAFDGASKELQAVGVADAMIVSSAAILAVSAYVLPWYSVGLFGVLAAVGTKRGLDDGAVARYRLWVPYAIVQSSLVLSAHLLAPGADAPVGQAHHYKWLELVCAFAAFVAFVWTLRSLQRVVNRENSAVYPPSS